MSAGRPVPFYKRKSFQIAIGLAVTLVSLVLVFGMIVREEEDPRAALRAIGDAFQQANYWTLLPIWALLFLFYWLKAVRWRMLLSPLGDFHVMRELFPPIMVGFAFNNILPAHLGEFVRIYVFSRKRSVSNTAVLASVVLERILDVIAILTYLVIGLLFVPGLDPSIRATAYGGAALGGGGILVVAFYLSFTRPFVAFVERCLEYLAFIPDSLRQKVAGILETGADGLAAIKDWRLLVKILLNSFLQWGVNGLIILVSLWSFDIHVPLLAATIVLGVVAFGITVPSTPGYFGVLQVLFVLSLKLFVDDDARVSAASVYFHMSQYIPVTLLGLYFFGRSGFKVADVRREAEQQRTSPVSIDLAREAGDSAAMSRRETDSLPCWPTVFFSSRPSTQQPAAWESNSGDDTWPTDNSRHSSWS